MPGAIEVQIAVAAGAKKFGGWAEASDNGAGSQAIEARPDDSQLPVRIPPHPRAVTVAEVERERAHPRPAGLVITPAIGGVHMGPLDVDLDRAGGAFVIGGPRGSGRSTALLAAAASISGGDPGRPIFIVAPRRSPLTRLAGTPGVEVLNRDTLAADLATGLRQSEPAAVLIDDAELLVDDPVSRLLDDVVRSSMDDGCPVLIAGTTTELLRRYAGWIFQARQSRSGFLLQPSGSADGELLDLRLPRTIASGSPATQGEVY